MSSVAAERLAIEWETKHLITVERTGYSGATAPLHAIFDGEFAEIMGKAQVRPGMVWFLSLTPDPKAEKQMFDDENVVIASRWFNNAKVYVEDIRDKAARDQYAKTVPSVIFLDAKGNEVTRLTGAGISASSVFAAQQQVAASQFRDTLATLVSRYAAFLKKLDKASATVENLETELQEHKDHVVKHDCENGRRAIKETEAELTPAKAEKTKLLAEEKQLLTPPVKTAPVVTPKVGATAAK